MDRVTSRRAATERSEEQLLVGPHHSLGSAGRAAGVQDVAVLARAGATNGFRGRAGDCALPGGAPGEEREGGRRNGEDRRELGIVQDHPRPAVVEHRGELGGHGPVVQVDGDGPQLEAGEQRLEVLVAVAQGDADRIVATDAQIGEDVGEAVGPLAELAVGEALLGLGVGTGAHDCLPVADRRHHRLEQVGKVE